MRGKEIKDKYGAVKGKTLMETRRKQGWYYEDPDFPGDEDDACRVSCFDLSSFVDLLMGGCLRKLGIMFERPRNSGTRSSSLTGSP